VERKLAHLQAQHDASSRAMHIVKGLVSSYLLSRASSSSWQPTESDDLRLLDSAVKWCHRQQVFVDLARNQYYSRMVVTDLDVMLRCAIGDKTASITLNVRDGAPSPRGQPGDARVGDSAEGAAHEVATLRCSCDSTLLEIVVKEALSNARKYRDPSSALHIRAELCGSRLHTTVTNRNKPGLPKLSEEQCVRVFDAGFVGEAGAKTSNGLGLDTVRVAAEAAKGRAWLSTATEPNGDFTSLHFCQPASPADDCSPIPLRPSGSGRLEPRVAAPLSGTHLQSCADEQKLKVVCVDDQRLLLHHMRTLCQHVLPVDMASSSWIGGNQAELDAFVDLALGRLDADMNPAAEPRQADITILDQNLLLDNREYLVGTELVTELRAQGFRGKCLLVTASVGSQLVEIRNTAGIDAVMSKGDPRIADSLKELARAHALKCHAGGSSSSAHAARLLLPGAEAGAGCSAEAGAEAGAGSSAEARDDIGLQMVTASSPEEVLAADRQSTISARGGSDEIAESFKQLAESFKLQAPTVHLSHKLKGLASVLGLVELSHCVKNFEENPSETGITRMQQLIVHASQPQPAETDSQSEPSPFTSPADLLSTGADATKATPPWPTGVRILIADDSMVNRRLLERSLQKAASGCMWTVEMAASPMQALELSRERSFDLFFLDESFGDDQMAGSEVARLIRQDEMQRLSQHRAVLVSYSGNNEEESSARLDLMACGFDCAWGKARPTDSQLAHLSRLLAKQGK